eukprot:gene5665-1013_t
MPENTPHDTPCRAETAAYRQCLQERKASGRACSGVARRLEACRERFRNVNAIDKQWDTTRIVPAVECRPLNDAVQRCLTLHPGGEEAVCKSTITSFERCMREHPGISVPQPRGSYTG